MRPSPRLHTRLQLHQRARQLHLPARRRIRLLLRLLQLHLLLRVLQLRLRLLLLRLLLQHLLLHLLLLMGSPPHLLRRVRRHGRGRRHRREL